MIEFNSKDVPATFALKVRDAFELMTERVSFLESTMIATREEMLENMRLIRDEMRVIGDFVRVQHNQSPSRAVDEVIDATSIQLPVMNNVRSRKTNHHVVDNQNRQAIVEERQENGSITEEVPTEEYEQSDEDEKPQEPTMETQPLYEPSHRLPPKYSQLTASGDIIYTPRSGEVTTSEYEPSEIDDEQPEDVNLDEGDDAPTATQESEVEELNYDDKPISDPQIMCANINHVNRINPDLMPDDGGDLSDDESIGDPLRTPSPPRHHPKSYAPSDHWRSAPSSFEDLADIEDLSPPKIEDLSPPKIEKPAAVPQISRPSPQPNTMPEPQFNKIQHLNEQLGLKTSPVPPFSSVSNSATIDDENPGGVSYKEYVSPTPLLFPNWNGHEISASQTPQDTPVEPTPPIPKQPSPVREPSPAKPPSFIQQPSFVRQQQPLVHQQSPVKEPSNAKSSTAKPTTSPRPGPSHFNANATRQSTTEESTERLWFNEYCYLRHYISKADHKEIGSGDLKLFEDLKSGHLHCVAEDEESGKVIIKFVVGRGLKLQRGSNNQTFLVWNCRDLADTTSPNGKQKTVICQFPDLDTMNVFEKLVYKFID